MADLEPWLRGTHKELDAVRRQVVHALEQAHEDAMRWSSDLSAEQLSARPFGTASVAFHLRHMVRSLDRLLTYAEARELSEDQLLLLRNEQEPVVSTREELVRFEVGMELALERILALDRDRYEEWRGVGRALLPSTLGGLLVHCAEHTQRHAGQMIVACQVAKGLMV